MKIGITGSSGSLGKELSKSIKFKKIYRFKGRLENLGINVEVVDLRTLRPIDSETIIDSVNKTGRGLIVQEDTKAISVSSEVAAIIAENCFFNLDAPVSRITPIEIPPMPFSPLQEAEYMPSKNKIIEGIKKLMEI